MRANTSTVTRDDLMTAGARPAPAADRPQSRHARSQPATQAAESYTDRVNVQSVRGTGYALTLAPARGAESAAGEGRAPGTSHALALLADLPVVLAGARADPGRHRQRRGERPPRTAPTGRGSSAGSCYAQAARAFESGGPDALESWLQSLPGRGASRAPSSSTLRGARDAAVGRCRPALAADTSSKSGRRGPIAPIGGALVLVGPGGSTYHVVIGPLRDSPRLFGELEQPGVPLSTLVIALGRQCRGVLLPGPLPGRSRGPAAAGDAPHGRRRPECARVCRHCGPPGRSRAARRGPRLHGRAAAAVCWSPSSSCCATSRTSCARPLARLQLALSLARRGDGNAERHLARIAFEADRLEQLIARTLRLARLERPAGRSSTSASTSARCCTPSPPTWPSRRTRRAAWSTCRPPPGLVMSGDPELLRSAFENVIRNAVRYSPAGTLVVDRGAAR